MNIAVRSVLIGTTYKKAGTSELHSTLIVLVITIIAGAAVFGFANSQASVTEKAFDPFMDLPKIKIEALQIPHI